MPVQIKDTGKTPQKILDDFKLLKTQIMPLIANQAEKFINENFDKEGFQGDTGLQKWEKRKTETPQTEGKKILNHSGHLRNLLDRKIQGNVITIYVKSPADTYAGIHNEGGTINVPVTAKSKKWAWMMFKATKNPMYKAMALTKKSSLTIHMPKRQFMGNSAELNRRIITLIERKLKTVFQ